MFVITDQNIYIYSFGVLIKIILTLFSILGMFMITHQYGPITCSLFFVKHMIVYSKILSKILLLLSAACYSEDEQNPFASMDGIKLRCCPLLRVTSCRTTRFPTNESHFNHHYANIPVADIARVCRIRRVAAALRSLRGASGSSAVYVLHTRRTHHQAIPHKMIRY